jgi:low temperature requirement protein LtrA
MIGGARQNFLRVRREHEHNRVTFAELFFDLVFVFAVTQLSHGLLEHLSFVGAVQTLVMFTAVWWAWMYTTWFTNWLDPERTPVRLLLLVQMLAGLFLSSSIPRAFDGGGLVFAAAYVFMQVGRSLFTIWAVHRHEETIHASFRRIVSWQALAGALWIAGGLAPPEARLGLWIAAMAVDFAGPQLGYWTPGLGRSLTSDWNIEGAHMAERCGLFIIIALGESILVTGATYASLPLDAPHTIAFVIAFIGSVAMWWVYFDTGAERGSRRIAGDDDPGRLARLSYTYLHIPIVAGIIVVALGDELVLAHPSGHTSTATALAIVGGPALYLLGNLLFKRSVVGRWPLSHLVGLGLLAAVAPASLVASPLVLSGLTTGVILVVAAWETRSLRGRHPLAAEEA